MIPTRRKEPDRLTRDLIIILLALSSAVMGLMAYLAMQARRDISERFVDNAAKPIATRFQDMVNRTESALGMVRDWGASGLMALSDKEKLKEVLLPFFGEEWRLSGISIADTLGNRFSILPDGTVREPSEAGLYDPAQCPWFASVPLSGEVFWTEIHRFFAVERHGATVAVAWPGKEDGRRTVAAFDILLEDLFDDIQQMAPTPASRAFVFLPDGSLYVPGSESEQPEFCAVSAIKDQLTRQGILAWVGGDEFPSRQASAQIKFEGRVWWCGFIPLEKSYRQVWVGVMVPESDITGDITRRRMLLLGIGVAVALMVAALYAWLIWHYNRMLRGGDDRFDAGHAE